MTLKDFIKSVILDIGAANDEIRNETGHNYVIAGKNNSGGGTFGGAISFDIAVTQSSEKSKGGGLQVAVFGVGGNASKEQKDIGENISRIKFDLLLSNDINVVDEKTLNDEEKMQRFRYKIAREKFIKSNKD